jgi:hypothetical protein
MSWRRGSARTHGKMYVSTYVSMYLRRKQNSISMLISFLNICLFSHCLENVQVLTLVIGVFALRSSDFVWQRHKPSPSRNANSKSTAFKPATQHYIRLLLQDEDTPRLLHNVLLREYESTKTHLVRSSVWSPPPRTTLTSSRLMVIQSCRANSLDSHTVNTDKQSEANYTCDCHCSW